MKTTIEWSPSKNRVTSVIIRTSCTKLKFDIKPSQPMQSFSMNHSGNQFEIVITDTSITVMCEGRISFNIVNGVATMSFGSAAIEDTDYMVYGIRSPLGADLLTSLANDGRGSVPIFGMGGYHDDQHNSFKI